MTEPGSSSSSPSYQHAKYESLYSEADSEYGFPDRKIVDRILQGRRILSLGCGTGSDIWYLGENALVGLDYATSGLLVGQRHGLKGVCGDLNANTRLPFVDRCFDIVICKDILEHLLDPLALLGEVRRVLKEDGYAVISVPNHFYLPLRIRILLGHGLRWKTIGHDHRQSYTDWNYMHIRFFTYAGFRQLLKAAALYPEKWFWDLGTLAHYHNPDMWLEPQRWKRARGLPMSRRGRWGLYLLDPVWKIFNRLFPRSLRSAIVSLAPGLLCAGFYARVRKCPRSSS
jgi:SAM-dependent methyltransferase